MATLDELACWARAMDTPVELACDNAEGQVYAAHSDHMSVMYMTTNPTITLHGGPLDGAQIAVEADLAALLPPGAAGIVFATEHARGCYRPILGRWTYTGPPRPDTDDAN
ncbi:hypothetical protein GCM10022402_10710 [Salinactinospora qingdaonensis]|uniref:Uncharacterized protein n=1 Tax=Salinactinospora qingdaonensis TaxID=702744 RepID=A0ABP7F5P8_9ACTN